MTKKIAAIIAKGDTPSIATLQKLKAWSSYLICTDGAGDFLFKTEIIPDLIIGDLDSISEEARDFYRKDCDTGKTKITCRESQHASDLEKALDACLESGFDEVIVTGLKGGRIDHTLTNFMIIAKYAEKLKINYIDDEGYGLCCSSARPIILNLTKDTLVSLVPLTAVNGIQTQGLLYPLTDEALAPGVREGLSNRASSDSIKISTSSGCLFVYINENTKKPPFPV